MSKACSKCGATRSLDGFYRNADAPDGRRPECKDCTRAAKREAYQREGATWRERNKAWRRSNPGYALGQMRAWKARGDNAQRLREYTREWRAANREHGRAHAQNRRVQKMNAPAGRVTAAEWRSVREAFGHRCAYCASVGPMQMEHVDPLSRGGAHDIGNVVPACRECNAAKKAKPLLLWLVLESHARQRAA